MYETNKVREPYASWGQDSEQMIYTLLHVKGTSSVLALTLKGMYAFNSNLDDSAILEPRVSVPNHEVNNVLSEGIIIPKAGNVSVIEVWACSQTVYGFTILDPKEFNILEETTKLSVKDNARKVQHMQPIMVNGRSFLAVANQHFIEHWDIEYRQKVCEYNMMIHCKEYYGDQSKIYHDVVTHNRTTCSILSNFYRHKHINI